MRTVALIVIVFLVLTLTLFFFMKEVMVTRPGICKYCHFMTPFYNKWEQSTHRMVPCMQCHEYGPLRALSGQLRLLIGTYHTRPLTNVPDAKCLQQGCHDMRLVESKVTMTKWNIAFDHKPHFTEQRKGMRLHCRSCHSDIVQGEHMKVSVNVCFLCHLGPGEAKSEAQCVRCHREARPMVTVGGKSFRHLGMVTPGRDCTQQGDTCVDCHAETLIGTGAVSKERCFFCHVDRTGQYHEVAFVHQKHVEEKQLDCLFCHEFVQHGNVRMATDLEERLR